MVITKGKACWIMELSTPLKGFLVASSSFRNAVDRKDHIPTKNALKSVIKASDLLAVSTVARIP